MAFYVTFYTVPCGFWRQLRRNKDTQQNVAQAIVSNTTKFVLRFFEKESSNDSEVILQPHYLY